MPNDQFAMERATETTEGVKVVVSLSFPVEPGVPFYFNITEIEKAVAHLAHHGVAFGAILEGVVPDSGA